MTSKFITDSQHPEMTRLVSDHFFGADKAAVSGKDAGKQFGLGGTSAWNDPGQFAKTGGEDGLMNRAPFGVPGDSLFNGSSPPIPRATGVNYQPASNAGHTVKDDPFSGSADGMPGDARVFKK